MLHFRIAAVVAALAALLTAGAGIAGAQGASGDPVQVVDVATRDNAAKNRLQRLGLDLTEHGDANSVEVVLHGADDARRLREAGFSYRVRIADLEAQTRRDREADAQYAARSSAPTCRAGGPSTARSPTTSASSTQLAQRYPALVKPITLPLHDARGPRSSSGIEITRDARDVDDGKPIFLQMGAHHAREWPSAEHAMEFAYDLLRGYGTRRAHDAARRRDADDRRPGRQPGRVQRLARAPIRATRPTTSAASTTR